MKKLGIIALALLFVAACKSKEEQKPAESAPAGGQAMEAPKTLQIVDTKVGTGKEAANGKKIKVHYVGTLMDGKKFDSSRDRNQPFEFTLGQGMVIKGWDEGVKGMKVGGIRQLTIPPDMGYGAAGAGNVIPPNSTLKFEVELVDVN